MPNGYCEAMRLFTKIIKVLFSVLREYGHLPVVFVDDSLLQGDTNEECSTNVSETVSLLRKVGFTINIDKSILIPTQILELLGFLLNSTDMTVSLSNEKKDGLKLKIYKFLSFKKPTIRDLASVEGSIISTFPAASYWQMHYRQLERFKNTALQQNDDDFESQWPSLPGKVHDELTSWLSNLDKCIRPVMLPKTDHTIETDANHLGWGA